MPFFSTKKNTGTGTNESSYGNVHFISFYSAVLARFAYFSDKNFLEQYNKIIGPIIPLSILTEMNSITDIPEILDDSVVFDLNNNPNQYPTFSFEGKKFIAFNEMAKKINMINGEVKETYELTPEEEKHRGAYGNVKYISIATSNYGEIYVVADKRMPNCIWVLFRGTYSGKTAGAYTKPSSLIPLYVGNSQGKRESYLYGIFKLLTDSIHTIIEACRYLAENHLDATNPDSVKVFTTGHSLGAALSTIFAYVWMHVRVTAPYNSAPYSVLTRKICCVSLGSPRCFNNDISELFCEDVAKKDITFLRVSSRGDPVTSMPFKTAYFSHPCSDSVSVKKGLREVASESCNGLYKITTGKPGVYYDKDLDCLNKKTRTYLPNPLKHTIYLNILFRSAVDIPKFMKSIFSAAEIKRTPSGSTECRLIIYDCIKKVYKVVFFDLNESRLKPVVDNTTTEQTNNPMAVETDEKGWKTIVSTTGGGGGISLFGNKSKGTGAGLNTPKDVVEDVRMTAVAFNKLMEAAVEFDIMGPLPMQGKIEDPFTTDVAPNVCVKITPVAAPTVGGRKTRKRKITRRKPNKGNKKSRKH
jgi:hypothetical protein